MNIHIHTDTHTYTHIHTRTGRILGGVNVVDGQVGDICELMWGVGVGLTLMHTHRVGLGLGQVGARTVGLLFLLSIFIVTAFSFAGPSVTFEPFLFFYYQIHKQTKHIHTHTHTDV